MPPDDRRPPISPQLALRVAVFGGIALVLLGIIFFRLWSLEILSGKTYLAEANDNGVRDERVQAPRGDVVDREGRVMVDNRTAIVVQLNPRSLPPVEQQLADSYGASLTRLLALQRRDPGRYRGQTVPMPAIPAPNSTLTGRFQRLGAVLGMSAGDIQSQVIHQLWLQPYSNITLKTDVPEAVYAYLLERNDQFPGVIPQPTFLRDYPYGGLGAQLFGTIGQISPQELKEPRFRGVPQGSIVGQNGIELSYDQYLRGRDGARRVVVDAGGQPKGTLSQVPPVAGDTLRLSIDIGLEQAGQQALQRAFGLARQNHNPAGAGAFVALDPRDGSVLAMGSLPTFDPTALTRPITQAQYSQLFGSTAGSPLVNRAIQGLYPTGSTFKAITATAAMQSGAITPTDVIVDNGSFQEGPTLVRHNAGGAAYGVLTMSQAIKVSSDVFFYNLGARLAHIPGLPLQTWAHRLGLGQPTGIDLPGEAGGTIPDPAWRAEQARLEIQCEQQRHVPSCGISDKRPWAEGDNVNLAVGQGDLQATPLQLAVAYSTLENGGTVVRPHLGLDIESPSGRVLQRIEPGSPRQVAIDPTYRQTILTGLHLAASSPGGTSADVFAGWPQNRFPVYGKTGTAQVGSGADQSWYVCFVPDPQRPIVVAVTVEHGGFGAQAAAPAARLILSQWFGLSDNNVKSGSSLTF